MSWRLFGERIETSDFASDLPRVYQPVVFNKNIALKAIRTWIVIFNAPVFTSMQFVICNSQEVLHTFDKEWTLAELSDEDYALKEIYFDFDNAISLDDSIEYNFAILLNGYTGNGGSHVAWVRGFPDPNNTIDVSIDPKNIAKMPFWMGFVTSEL